MEVWKCCHPSLVLRSDAPVADSVFPWGDGPGDFAGSFPFPFFNDSICKYEGILKRILSLNLLMFCTKLQGIQAFKEDQP